MNSSEFKNFNEKKKNNANANDFAVSKPQPSAVSNEKLIENKKKMSLKSTSKPFTMNGPAFQPEQKLQNNNTNNTLVDVLPTNKPEQITQGTFTAPVMNFADSGSSSYPKLTNKNKLKPPIPTTNSSNELEKLKKESNNLQNIQKSAFNPSEKTHDNSNSLENKTKILAPQKNLNPITEEKTQIEEKK